VTKSVSSPEKQESSIIWTKYCAVDLTDGCWSPTKCSLFYLSRVDGNLEAWDLLQQQSEPILTVKVRVILRRTFHHHCCCCSLCELQFLSISDISASFSNAQWNIKYHHWG